MATLIRLAQQDNVAVATRNFARGAAVTVEGEELTTRDPLGHQEFILGYKSFEPLGPACLPV